MSSNVCTLIDGEIYFRNTSGEVVAAHDVADALVDMLDGQSTPSEIVYQTGVSEDRAKKISEIFRILLDKKSLGKK